MKAGWIGLGAMGLPMAGHLHAAGLLASVWNRDGAKTRSFAESGVGIPVAATPADLAGQVDVVLICVSADQDLRQVVEALRPGLAAGMAVVDHSTVAPATARELAANLGQTGVEFMDAPVSGGVEGAAAGRLAIMAGGGAGTFERLRRVFDSYARISRHLGPAGSGQAAKAINQLMVAGISEAVCEALALMERLELPRGPMLELLGCGAAGNWFLEKRGETMLADSFRTGFDPRLLFKDLKICEQLCNEADFESGIVRQALADYRRLIDSGQAGGDISSLIRIKRG